MKVIETVAHPEGFTLYPLSDVHWPEHDHNKLRHWLSVVESDPTAIVTLGGDLFDFARGKYRMHLSGYTADSNSRSPLDDMAEQKVYEMCQFLASIRHKIVATCVGNHFYTFPDGKVSDQLLAIRLNRADTFVGALGLVRVKDFDGKGDVVIALHHDAGRKGGTISSDVLAFVHWSHNVLADIYVAGHTHRQYALIPFPRMTVDNNNADRIGDKKMVFVRSGAFLRTFNESVTHAFDPFVPDYGEVKMLNPSLFGVLGVKVAFNEGKPQYQIIHTAL